MVLKGESLVLIAPNPLDLKSKKMPPPITDVNKNVIGGRFEVRETSSKGHAMFATAPIPLGSVIFSEQPLIHMPDAIFNLEDSDRVETWLDRRINGLSCDQREVFFNLADSRTPEVDGVADKTVLGIFYTNDMSYDGDAALFPTLARVNHACVANADFVSRPEKGVQELVATKDIREGEEITISYLPAADEGSAPTDVRRAYLREWYGFQCLCRTCCMEVKTLPV